MNEKEFQEKISQALQEKRGLPAALENALFLQAGELLATRRERLSAREVDLKRTAQTRARRLTHVVEFFAIRPYWPATAATCAALIFAVLTLLSAHRPSPSPSRQITFADLPEFPRNNDASKRYDEQRLAETQAYEREVEDAHQRTSGGI
jgi:hypothetical protein